MRICDDKYPPEDTTLFNSWDFTLSDFQKYAVEGTSKGVHILATAHTGSGKTLIAEFAILHMHRRHKRVIYTSPIKALSNQKMREFQMKFPDITFGILTGDNRFNPEADVLVMTTEILRNTLFQQRMIQEGTLEKKNADLYFDMDFDKELGCVIFDEVHYINDQHRGTVWEETIMMLPETTQMIMLSATIDKPDKFASWVEKEKDREVWLCPTKERVIPLTHYSYFTLPESQFKKFPQAIQTQIRSIHETPLILKEQGKSFLDKNYHLTKNVVHELTKSNVWVNQFFAFNQLIAYLKKQERLPAIAFIFSRAKAQLFAEKVSISLFEDGSKIPSIIEKECKQILMKLPNYTEYLQLPEYTTLIKLLQKGIAVHHAGMPQVFRELIENLFDKKYIRLLCATETFAVGINMPTKSVIFPSLYKFDGIGMRPLYSHEYGQMAGRAGRRGIDTFGSVYHMANLILNGNNELTITPYREMLTGKPPSLTSKFQIHYNLLLRLISVHKFDFHNFISKSMMMETIQKELSYAEGLRDEAAERLRKKILHLKTDKTILQTYIDLHVNILSFKGKKRKAKYREIARLESIHPDIQHDKLKLDERDKLTNEITSLENQVQNIKNYIQSEIDLILGILSEEKFICRGDDNHYTLTEKGEYATNIQEIHCLALADIVKEGAFNHLSNTEFVAVLSAFARVSMPTDQRVATVEQIVAPPNVINLLKEIQERYHYYNNIETRHQLTIIENVDLSWDLCELVIDWCNADSEEKCRKVYENAQMYCISLGEFIKAILKINNVARELEKVALIQSNLTLLDKIKNVPLLTLKSVVTNQSLYL